MSFFWENFEPGAANTIAMQLQRTNQKTKNKKIIKYTTKVFFRVLFSIFLKIGIYFKFPIQIINVIPNLIQS